MPDIEDHAHLSVVYPVEKGDPLLDPIIFLLEVLDRNDYLGTLDMTCKFFITFLQRSVH